jgi:hypothetical protein
MAREAKEALIPPLFFFSGGTLFFFAFSLPQLHFIVRFWFHPHKSAHKGLGFHKVIGFCHDGLYIVNSKPLLWPHRKIKWANAEIKKLEAKINTRFKRDSYPTRSRVNSERTEEVHYFRAPNVTAEMQVSVKNILQTLREPLDNTLAIISEKTGGKTSGISFPFGDTMKKYCAELTKLEQLLPEEAVKIIRNAKTYPGGNEHLRALHYIARDQRHRIPIDLINVGLAFHMNSLGIRSGQLIRLGYRNGSHMVLDTSNNLVVPDGVPAPEMLFDRGDGLPTASFRPGPGDNQMEFITVTPGTKFEADIKPSFNIALAEVPAFKREPIIITLKQISQLVEGIILTFERRFFP